MAKFLVKEWLWPLAGAALMLTACAKSPSSIAPTAVNSAEYDHLDCLQKRKELARISHKLHAATQRQKQAQKQDALTMFLILVPASTVNGDAEADVARYKGEKLALERAIDRHCTS